MKDKKDEKRKPPLASWVDIVQPAILATTTGNQRFIITIKLPERSLKSASSFVMETNDALQSRSAKSSGSASAVQFVLVDSERARLQRAVASFTTFKDANACLRALTDLGLKTTKVSAELEDFGKKQYDPWYETIASAWWPWLARWRNPPPEMAMAQVTNRLNLTEGSKYAEGPGGKLGKSEDVERNKTDVENTDLEDDAPSKEERPREKKPRRAKE